GAIRNVSLRIAGLLALVIAAGCTSAGRNEAVDVSPATEPVVESAEAEPPGPELSAIGGPQARATTAEFGIEPLALRLSAAGQILDFRYRVVDTDRAARCLARDVRPYVLVPGTGARLDVPHMPKIGSLRQVPRAADPGRVYFALFVNTERQVQQGDKVTVALGDCVFQELVVE
ncbi:MAG: hypothetical protein AB1716_19645, partial [Planctomycetota bacterium]